MNEIIKVSKSKEEFQRFNIVWKWTKVHSLMEIATTNCNSIKSKSWNENQVLRSNILWLYKNRPNEKSIQTWRRLLSQAFLKNRDHQIVTKTTYNPKMKIPLQQWTHESNWFWYQYKKYDYKKIKHLYIQTDSNPNSATRNIHMRIQHS